MIEHGFGAPGAAFLRAAFLRFRRGALPVAAVFATLAAFSGAPAQAQTRVCDIAVDVGEVIAVPVDCTIPGTTIDLSGLGTGVGDLLEGEGENATGLLFQQAAGLTQAFASITGGVSASITSQVLELGLADSKIGGPSGGAIVNGPLVSGTPGSELSMFAVSGVTKVNHDGYRSSSSIPGGGGRTPEFEEIDYGFTLGLRWDASDYFDAAKNSVTFGLIANYTHTDIDLGTNEILAKYFDKTGSADIDSWSVGAYGLVTDGFRYGLVTVTTTFGAPETQNFVLDSTADYDTRGVAASALSGVLIPMGSGSTLDLRGGFNFVSASADSYTDSIGLRFSDAELEEISGTASARLFHVVKLEQGSFRPFIQGGVTHRLHYSNEVEVEGVKFTFEDADTTVFARAGVDFDIHRSLQAYVAVRGDKNEDLEAIAAQVGLTFKLD